MRPRRRARSGVKLKVLECGQELAEEQRLHGLERRRRFAAACAGHPRVGSVVAEQGRGGPECWIGSSPTVSASSRIEGLCVWVSWN